MTPEQKGQQYARKEVPNIDGKLPEEWLEDDRLLVHNAFLAGYAAKEEEVGWISVNDEQKPSHYTYIAAYNEIKDHSFIVQYTTDHLGRISWFDLNGFEINVCGWKYLPMPPKPKTT